ncbi:sel1 repeat family protein (plasmid) [Ensifer sp. D2-11]
MSADPENEDGAKTLVTIEEKHTMPRESRKITAAPSAVIVLTALMITTAMTPATAAPTNQQATAASAPSSESESEAAVSPAAAKALRLIARSRGELAKNDVDAADRELGRALGLLDLVQSSLSGRTIKDETWTATKGTPAYREVDLALNATRRLVTEAQEALRRKNVEAANAALEAAEDNVVYLSVVVQEPLAKAHRSLWQAAQDYADGAYDAAKADVDRGIGYLNQEVQNTDTKTRKAAQNLSDEAQSLRADIDTKSADVPSRLDGVWQRAKALSERGVEYVAAGLQRAGTKSDLKADVIEAKLHLSFAEIAGFTTHDAEQAAQELGLTLSYMDQAIDQASDAQAPQIIALRTGIADLAEEAPADQKNARYVELKGELARVIEARAGLNDDTVDGGVAALRAGNGDVALQILKPLAEAGNAEAAFWLGDMYEQGLGVPTDMKTTLKWYTKAAEGSWTAAEMRLGEIYFNGIEAVQDFEKAHKWLEQAAHGGDSVAQLDVGKLYANGWGVKKDPIWAYVWYEIAAREGNYEAQQLRDALVKTMPEGDVVEAQKLTQQVASEVPGQINAG